MIHFEDFIHAMEHGLEFFFLVLNCSSTTVEKTPLCLTAFCVFGENQVTIYMGLFLDSVLTHGSICVSSLQNHSVLSIMDL